MLVRNQLGFLSNSAPLTCECQQRSHCNWATVLYTLFQAAYTLCFPWCVSCFGKIGQGECLAFHSKLSALHEQRPYSSLFIPLDDLWSALGCVNVPCPSCWLSVEQVTLQMLNPFRNICTQQNFYFAIFPLVLRWKTSPRVSSMLFTCHRPQMTSSEAQHL